MTVRNGVLVGNLLRVALAVIAALSVAEARAAGIFRDLTPLDRSEPILVSQAGDVIALRSPGHPGAGLASTVPPAFLAFPLHGGEHIPASTPVVDTGSQPGVGPLDLTPAVLPTLDADLLAKHGAIVRAPGGSYAVAILPRYARALDAQAAASGSGSSPAKTLGAIFGVTPHANWTIQGIPSNKLTQWIKTGSNEINHLTSLGLNRIDRTLGVKITPLPATPTGTTPVTTTGTTTAAQTLTPPGPASPATSPSTSPSTSLTPPPSPIPSPAPEAYATPEPGGWLVFGLILAAGALRRRHINCSLDS